MMDQIIALTGNWGWIIFALLLLGIEILAPSTFLLWPGLAALLVGFVTLILGADSAIWPWQAQVIVFLVASLIIAWFGRDYMKNRNLDDSDKPTLNERGSQMIGRTAILTTAIENGQGRAKFGDSSWVVRGPDAGEGAKVRVVNVEGSVLEVELV